MSLSSIIFASLSFSSVHDVVVIVVGVAAVCYSVYLASRLSTFALFLLAVSCLFIQNTDQ